MSSQTMHTNCQEWWWWVDDLGLFYGPRTQGHCSFKERRPLTSVYILGILEINKSKPI